MGYKSEQDDALHGSPIERRRWAGQKAQDLEEGSNQGKRLQLAGLLSPPAAETQAAGYNLAERGLASSR